jgi:hypothetical protein
MDMDWCLACNKQFVSRPRPCAGHRCSFVFLQTSTDLSYCSIECMSREDLPIIASPAPHAVNSRLRARLEGPSPIGWSRKVREPRSRSMSRARPRPSNTPRAPPVIHLGFDAEERAPSPESEVAWSLPAAGGATRLVGSRWMGKDYDGIKCWAHGVRGFPDDDISDEDDDSDVFEAEAATQPIFPIQAPSFALSASRPAPATLSTQLSITPKHHLSLLTYDDTASLATPVTDICLAQGYVETHAQSPNTPPNQAALHLRRFVNGSLPITSSVSKTPKDRSMSSPAPCAPPKSLSAEPVWIAQTTRAPLRIDAQRGRDWGGLYDYECEKQQLASDRIGSFVPPSSWSRGRTRERSNTEVLYR